MRIKVTGYLNTEDLDPACLDLNHETGITQAFYESIVGHGMSFDVGALDDLEFELEDDRG